jgi:hypothetical protein
VTIITMLPILGTNEYVADPEQLTLAAIAQQAQRPARVSARLGAWAVMPIERSPVERSFESSTLADAMRHITVRP